jgi:hypothetical protein
MDDGNFYLGRIVDHTSGEQTDTKLLYDPADLTTHGVIVGMTGSGKTGLCLDLMEEAALNNVPAIMIDPKGDITNALLHFPDLAPADFAPWINPDEARRDGKSVAEAAADIATLWRNGLASWDIQPERIQKLKNSAQFSIYTPGSDAGIPISILSSLKAPALDWEANKEPLREQIAGTVTAILGLAGLRDIDPLRSREHILLSTIFESAWSQGKDLSLGELIMQVQNPPFDKLGFFEVSTFYPDKDRFSLAMDLNNIMAAPSFQAWIEGEPLDIANLLYTSAGKPRHTIFYIAHLNDSERMFFVTLLYGAVESWMRTQSGTTSLRALVYFDEIFGYLPPVGNPPSKEPMLRLLKQARAFGVGMVLATQNPVDIDYKALSNAGTWFIGKLGTDQDKQRLLDGLSSAMGAGLDRHEYDNLISALGKRVFLLRNVHDKAPTLFQTRWAMNYLAGPATRNQIPALNALANSGQITQTNNQSAISPSISSTQSPIPQSPPPATPPALTLPGSPTRPQVPASVGEYFLPQNITLSESMKHGRQAIRGDFDELGILYRPTLLAQADIRFTNRKYNLDTDLFRTALVEEVDPRGRVRWEDFLLANNLEERNFDRVGVPDAHFVTLENPLNDGRAISSLEKDFVDYMYRNSELTIRANETLGVYAAPNVSDAEFQAMCNNAADDMEDDEIDKVKATYEKKIDAVEKKLKSEERELEEDKANLSARKREELTKHAETILGFFTKSRRSVSSSMTKRRMTQQAQAEVEESEEAIKEFQKELEALAKEQAAAVDAIEEKWDAVAKEVSEIKVTPYKKDTLVNLFGVAWMPYFVVADEGRLVEMPAFSPTS